MSYDLATPAKAPKAEVRQYPNVCLKHLPLDQIKIDRSFVLDVTSDPNDAAIVQTIIAMIEALGLNVIAEGVETEAQHDFLDKHGCYAFQGYLFGKPVPVGEFEALLGKQL